MYDILNRVNASNDVKKLNKSELSELASELRSVITQTVSVNGGHLASNLGIVEITVALHRVYDSSKDRIVFDVGHQSYAHKIITGRKERFSTLRKYKGISGFPKPCEAEDDAFIAGHASNSISVSLGMAKARTINKADYDVVAVIGDGALTGGLAYEGLLNAAASGEPIVIILNDNQMSINDNDGAVHNLLQNMRVKPAYMNFKKAYRNFMLHFPTVYQFNHDIKESIKSRLLPENMFTGMGFYYLGPINGHDILKLEAAFSWAKSLRVPVLVHVVTQKGKGVKYAEDKPSVYHGPGPFNSVTGELAQQSISFSDIFGEEMCDIASKNRNVVAVTAAMKDGTGLSKFAEKYSERFFDVGIAEEHAVSFCAGLSKQGIVPVFSVYSTFLQRAYDMLIHDISLLGLHTVFAVDRAGIVGNDGETHNGVFDVSYLSVVPGMTVLCPASYRELREMLCLAVEKINGPVAIRYPRGSEGEYKGSCLENETVLVNGTDITVVTYGIMINTALEVARLLANSSVSVEIVKLNRIIPADYEMVLKSVNKTGKLFVLEECASSGCIGEKIAAELEMRKISLECFGLINLGSGIVQHGNVHVLKHEYGIDAETITNTILKQLGK